ncbi:DUF1275 domain-containing protein [Streptomyces sp. Ru71]|uniref:YoaK family protein n=1 Tax=Streptomyces sp. Ru71 TaxID=2080746 RepID=UPI000CDE50F6|nr:YoaK family protein [Streptomyces sp. Ru71]POX57250.1 DUF1275 domain-containing protein [Streptomyces sp. Ru71]
MRRRPGDAPRIPVPAGDERHGPLPALLLTLTVVTGLVDAVSYLGLGRVFVGNMTGNVVLMGFALAGSAGLSALASVAALAAFLLGAFAGGRIGARYATHRGHLLRAAAAAQAVLVAVSVVVAAVAGAPVSAGARYTLIVLLGLAMGLQTAAARRLGVPELTTTVLTQTLTALAAGPSGRRGRGLLSVLAMFLGALVGALLVLHGHLVLTLGLALLLLAATSVTVHRLAATEPDWVRAGS